MRFLRNFLLTLLVLLGLTVLVVARFPAATAIGWLGGRIGPLELERVGGTVWEGYAQQTRVLGEPVGRLRWSLGPTSVLRGAPRLDLELEGERYQGRTEAVLAGRAIELSGTRLRLPAGTLKPALGIPGIVPDGIVELDLPVARIENGYPTAVQGRAVWREAVVSGADTVALGDIEMEFASQGGGIAGVIKDLGGPLQVEGSFEFGLRGYEAEVLLTPRSEEPALQRVLGRIGEPQPDGGRYLHITGSLLPVR